MTPPWRLGRAAIAPVPRRLGGRVGQWDRVVGSRAAGRLASSRQPHTAPARSGKLETAPDSLRKSWRA
eukprot:4001331-Alexandrium_andersonii.AAC.1